MSKLSRLELTAGENAPTEGQIKDKVADAKESANATLGDAAGKAQQGKQNVKRKV